MLGYLFKTIFDGLGQGPGHLLRPLFSGGVAFNHSKKKKLGMKSQVNQQFIVSFLFTIFDINNAFRALK